MTNLVKSKRVADAVMYYIELLCRVWNVPVLDVVSCTHVKALEKYGNG